MRNGHRPGRLLMFYDYDTQWAADRSRSPGGPKRWGADEFEATDRILELHAEFDIPACFAVVGAAALEGGRPYHDPQQIRRIHALGHEVASHAFRHEWIPGLGRPALLETLRRSRDALEQCTGAAVTTFVPPFNQPFDLPRRGAFSLSERRQVPGRDRIGIPDLCRALAEVGYRVSRISYRAAHLQAVERLTGRRCESPTRPVVVEGVLCARLNTPCGFADDTMTMLERCAREGGLAVVYAHPHSLRAGNSQDERYLIPFLARVRELRAAGRLAAIQPRDLTAAS